MEQADREGGRVAEIALHLFHAAPVGDPEKAVGYLLKAAQQAVGALAYEEDGLGRGNAIARRHLFG